jgi:hypothetical protein
LAGKPERKGQLGTRGGRILFKCILKTSDCGVWTGLSAVRIGTSSRLWWIRWWTVVFRRLRGIAWLCKRHRPHYTRVCHWPLSYARWIYCTYSYAISLGSLFIWTTHLRVGQPRGLWRICFPTAALLICLMCATCAAILSTGGDESNKVKSTNTEPCHDAVYSNPLPTATVHICPSAPCVYTYSFCRSRQIVREVQVSENLLPPSFGIEDWSNGFFQNIANHLPYRTMSKPMGQQSTYTSWKVNSKSA